jgi:LacI family transcriptional regulator
MKEIARRAGVTRQAVSAILNNKIPASGNTRPHGNATRDKVLRIAKDLNYIPNHFATSLKKGRTHLIGLSGSVRIAAGFSIYLNQVTLGIEEVISQQEPRNHLVVFPNNLTDSYEKSIELAEQRVMDGMIFVVLDRWMQHFREVEYPQLKKHNVPFVVIHSTEEEYPFNNVGLKNSQAGYLAGKHLTDRGYTDLGYYMSMDTGSLVNEPLKGFKKAVEEAGLGAEAVTVISPIQPAGDTLYGNNLAAHTFSKLERIPRALFIHSDLFAHFAVKALRDRGLRIPADVAVMGFDDINPFHPFAENLTTLHHPFKEKGAEAIRMLNDILDGKLDPDRVHRKLLGTELVVRNST